MSLIVTGFAPVADIRQTLTPQLRMDKGTTDLILIDLGRGQNRMGASILAQVHGKLGKQAPDVDDAEDLKAFFAVIQGLNADGHLLAYHDRSDGGLLTSVVEMAFAGHCGLNLNLDALAETSTEIAAILFNEELGAVIQVRQDATPDVLAQFSAAGLGDCVAVIGQPVNNGHINISFNGEEVFAGERRLLQRQWAETSYQIQRLRDNADCAEQEFDVLLEEDNPGLSVKLSFDVNQDIAAPYIKKGVRPQVAVLREQGVNGQVEMAAAFDRAGFNAIDVHMSDILAGRVDLNEFKGMVACGGFSYGDVLGAGEGWAKSALFNSRARDAFQGFFERSDTFTLGVCNGCQMMSNLHELIPGSEFCRTSCATVPSSSRPVWRWSRSRSRTRSSCRAWPVRACRSPSPTAKAMRNSKAQKPCSKPTCPVAWPCASSTTTARSPKAIRPTRTARRAGSPA